MPETQTLERKLEVRTGPLAEIFPLFDASTIQHAHEIMTDRRTDPSLRNKWFRTADFPMYKVEGTEAVLYFAPREHNLIFRDIRNATSQLLQSQNYVPTKEGIEEVVAASEKGAVLKVKLSDLRLQGNDNEWRYFEIDTSNPNSLNVAKKAFAERVYGQGNEFAENMRTLNEYGINKTRIFVLTPDYVKRKLKGKEDSAIARVSRLVWFGGGSGFDAVGRDVDDADGGLRGVLKESAEGAALEKIEEKSVARTNQGQMPYTDALNLVEQEYAPRSSPLFPVLERMLKEIYRIKQ